MKTKEELNIIKEEINTLNKKLSELTEEELKQVTGGQQYEFNIYENTVEKDKFKPNFMDQKHEND